MVSGRLTDVVCPECHARYKLVHVRAPSGSHAATVQCRICGHPMAGTDGDDILKYFLVDRTNVRVPPSAYE